MKVVGKKRSDRLTALMEPINDVLLPLGFRATGSRDQGDLVIAADWETDTVIVSAAVEPREEFGGVMIAHRLPGFLAGEQPYWAKVYLEVILRERGVVPHAQLKRRWPGASAEEVRFWANEAATDLRAISDLLASQNLELLDDLVARKPRQGVPGLDYPFVMGGSEERLADPYVLFPDTLLTTHPPIN